MMAIHSMTAFARETVSGDFGQLTFEIRTVNHRYLEFSCKLPEILRHLEMQAREKISERISRGKVDLSVKLSPGVAFPSSLTLNTALLANYVSVTDAVQSALGERTMEPLSVQKMMNWPDMVRTETHQDARIDTAFVSGLEQVLSEVLAVRAKEGSGLASVMVEQLTRLNEMVDSIQLRMPEVIALQRSKWEAKLSALQLEADSQRLESEMLLLIQKQDVTEEIDRLRLHIEETRRVVTAGGVIGRRLDFLMQELNREANTTASKSQDVRLTQLAVDMKVCVEQMREQVQNIE